MTRWLALAALPLAAGVLACAPPAAVDPALIKNPNPCAGSVLMISDGTKLPCTPTAGTVINVRLAIVVPLRQQPTAEQMIAANNRAIELGAEQVIFYPGSDPYAGFFEAENVDHTKVTT